MKLQNQRDFNKAKPPNRLPYHTSAIFTENKAEMLKIFLKELTFQGMRDPMNELANEEVEKLRQIIDKVYVSSQEKRPSVMDVEGIWPLLTFSFESRCGLELYLHFENLLTPIDYKPQIIAQNVKVQHSEQFNPQGYFQNNEWKINKKFMKSIRVLEKELPKNAQDAQKECLKMLDYLEIQVGESQERQKDFKTKFRDFFKKMDTQKKNKQTQSKLGGLSKVFASRMLEEQQQKLKQKYVFSEPDLLHNTFVAFTHDEYKHHHESKSLAKNQINPIIEEEEQQQDESSIIFDEAEYKNEHSARESRTLKNKRAPIDKLSSPTKRRMPGYHKLQSPRKRQIKRPPRKLVVERFFKLQKSKNIILEEIKRQKKKKDKQVKRNSRLDRVKRKIIESDEQQGRKQRKKRVPKIRAQDFSESESQLGDDSRCFHSYQHQRRRIDNSLQHVESQQEIVMKRKRNQFKGQKFYHNFIEDEASQDQSNFISEDTLQERTNKMDIEYSHKIINTKSDPYSIGKIRPNVQEVRPLENLKLENLQIRKLSLDSNFDLDINLDFNRYQDYLSYLQPKEIKKQVQKIIKQVINRQTINYDIDLTLKIIAAWTMSKITAEKRQQVWEQMNKLIISPLLEYIISTNCCRSNTEILNNFFVSVDNEDLTQLNKAKRYFQIIFQAGRSFNKYNLQEQLMKMFYNSMITPKKMAKVSMNTTFFAQCQIISLINPFKIGVKQAKFKLSQNQDKIAYLVGSLVLQTVFLEGSTNNSEFFKTRKKQFLVSLKQQLNELNTKYSPQWFYSLTNTIKKFYSCYNPNLDDEYFLTLVSFVNLSLEKLMIQSITSENDVETKNQTNFLLELITYFVDLKKIQGKMPYLLNLLNTLTVKSGVNKVLKDDKHSIISYMAYSSVSKLILKLLLPLQVPADQKDKIVAFFMKYLATLVPHFSKIVSPLKLNIYFPVFQLISQIYTYQIQVRLQKSIDSYYPLCQEQHKEIRSIIQRLWESLEKKYEEFNYQLQNLCNQMKKNVEKAYNIQNMNDIQIFQDKVDKCEKAIKAFLRNFLLPETINEEPCQLQSSNSHYFFGLEFVLKQNYFLKYLKKRNNKPKLTQLQSVILQVLGFWLKSPSTRCQQKQFESKYYESILEHYNNQYVLKKQIEMDIIADIDEPTVLQKFAMIEGTQIAAAFQHSKLINSPESNIMKLVKNSVNAYSAKFANIHKSVCCFQFLLERLQGCINEKQTIGNLQQRNRQIKKIKSYFWNNFVYKSARDIVLLIFLGFTTQHATDYQSIPLNGMLRKLRELIDINPRQINYKDIGYHYLLYSLQTLSTFNSIKDILKGVEQQKKVFGWKDFDKQLSTVLKDLFPSLKRLQQIERNKQPIITQSLKILCFIIQRPQPNSQLIKYYLKQTQMTSSVDSLITKLRVNEQNIQVLLVFFDSVNKMNDNPHRIKETMTIYINGLASANDKSLEHLKQAKRFLSAVRVCLANNAGLQTIGNILVKQFLQKFCLPSILQSSTKEITIQKLQIYLEMMKSSVHQRSAYQYFIVQNRKKYEQIIPRIMQNSNGDNRQHCKTFQNAVLTYMIGQYSNLLDIKRLLGSMKKDAMPSLQANPAKRKVYYDLIGKLRSMAIETTTEYITEWCNQQIKEIKFLDIFEEELMDIQ